jgi:hypothetical protein
MVEAKNQDLWKLLLVEVRWFQAEGANVSLWRIPSQFNARAKRFAQQATEKPEMSVFNIWKQMGRYTSSRGHSCVDLCVVFFRGTRGG